MANDCAPGNLAATPHPSEVNLVAGYVGSDPVRFVVWGRPYPWSAPTFGTGVSKKGRRYRFARKNPKLANWQKQVRREAKSAFLGGEPISGAVFLSLVFHFETKADRDWGRIVEPAFRWDKANGEWRKLGRLSDTTNLLKAVEDAMNGVAYIDDTQVRVLNVRCVWGGQAGVEIVVARIAREEKQEKNAEV